MFQHSPKCHALFSGLQAERFGGRIAVGARYSSLLKHAQTGSEAHTLTYSMGASVLSRV